MSEIIQKHGDDGVYFPTIEFRWLRIELNSEWKEKTLQQKFICKYSGEAQWRDVPTITTSYL